MGIDKVPLLVQVIGADLFLDLPKRGHLRWNVLGHIDEMPAIARTKWPGQLIKWQLEEFVRELPRIRNPTIVRRATDKLPLPPGPNSRIMCSIWMRIRDP